MSDGIPRRSVETDPVAQWTALLKQVQKALEELQRSGTSLRNSSISGGEGLTVYDDAGLKRTVLRGEDGALVTYDEDGDPVARFGPLFSRPGEYGGEVMIAGQWTALATLGENAISWTSILSKPATFTPSAHTHPGTEISTSVAQADGSQYGWTNNVAGTSFYQLWVGNDGGFHFGRNVSSIKYKENVRDFTAAPDAVLQLRPVVYDRKPTFRYPQEADGTRLVGPPQRFEGAKDQFGLIAQEVYEHLPELVTFFDEEIDGVKYELVGPALIPIIKAQAEQLARQDKEIAAMKAAFKTLGVTL